MGRIAPLDVHVAIFTQQISNYHAARYRAAATEFSRVTVVSVLNAAEFNEFMAMDRQDSNEYYGVLRVFEGQADYAAAIADGRLWRRVNEVLNELRPDAIAVAGWSFPESLAAISWAHSARVPVVVMSASQAGDAERSRIREWVKGRVVQACDAALVASERHCQYAVALGLPRHKVSLGYDAVDNLHFAEGADAARRSRADVRDAENLPERYILASGRFIAKKNFPRLVSAFAKALADKDSGHSLVILGDGTERAAIEHAITEHALGHRVLLPGYRSYHLLPKYYGLADGFVHVSLVEQWGLVINEAAACALPLIVSDRCGAASTLVQPGRNGWIVNVSDASSLARALGELMELSSSQREEMGRVSRKLVGDWGPGRFASGLVDAVRAAMLEERRALHPIDRLLFRLIARLQISTVN